MVLYIMTMALFLLKAHGEYVLSPVTADFMYFNADNVTKIFVALAMVYASTCVYEYSGRLLAAFILKWISILGTGFLMVRTIFNFFVSERITAIELTFHIFGLIFTLLLARYSYRNGNRK